MVGEALVGEESCGGSPSGLEEGSVGYCPSKLVFIVSVWGRVKRVALFLPAIGLLLREGNRLTPAWAVMFCRCRIFWLPTWAVLALSYHSGLLCGW